MGKLHKKRKPSEGWHVGEEKGLSFKYAEIKKVKTPAAAEDMKPAGGKEKGLQRRAERREGK